MANSTNFSNEFRIAFLFDKVCAYCGSNEDLTIDHVVPRAKGGTDDPENLVAACRSCNSTKKDMDLEHYLKYWAPRPKMSVTESLARARMMGA